MRRRSGFTLVEVLVSMALILFIMSILAGAFGAASQAVSDLKAAGDLAEKLRGATNVIKHDLGQDHFTESAQGSFRLSSPKFWDRLDPVVTPPPGPFGFFRIYETAQDVQESSPALDLDNIPSYVQTTASLHYTIAQHGSRRSDFLSAFTPGSILLKPNPTGPYTNADNFYQDSANVFSSQFAEVELFLGPTPDTAEGTPLFALYRRQQLAVPRAWVQTTAIPPGELATDLAEMSISNSAKGLNFNTMQDLSMPGKRFSASNPAGVFLPGQTYPPMNGASTAADLLLTDVLSFDVRILAGSVNPAGVVTPDNEFRDIADPQIQKFNTGLNPAYVKNKPPFIFDTWSNLLDAGNPANDYRTSTTTPGLLTTIPVFQDAPAPGGNKIIILAIQITLRVWDFKTKKTRQVTIVQQM